MHCAKSNYYKKRIGVSDEEVYVDCGEHEEKDKFWVFPKEKERLRRICGITEVGDLCDEPDMVGYLVLA